MTSCLLIARRATCQTISYHLEVHAEHWRTFRLNPRDADLMSPELSSIPLPESEGDILEKLAHSKYQNSQHPSTSPLSESEPSFTVPVILSHSETIPMASTPTTIQRSDGQKNIINAVGSCANADDQADASQDDSMNRDPAEKIPDFDWTGLHDRYRQSMEQCRASEDALNQEFERLMKVLGSRFSL